MPGHGHPQEAAEDAGGVRPGAPGAAALLQGFFRLQEGAVPHAPPPARGVQPRPRDGGHDLGGGGAVRHGLERLPLPGVEHVHGGRVALLDLQGVHVEAPLLAVDVDHDLRGVRDGPGGVGRVAAADQREVGDGLDVVEVGAREHEEVAEHLVAVPVGGEVGERVEDVEAAGARALDRPVDLGEEGLEPLLRVEGPDLDPWAGGDERLVAGEAEVDHGAAQRGGGLDVGIDQRPVVLDPVHLPDEVVPRDQPAEDAVQPGEARAQLRIDLGH